MRSAFIRALTALAAHDKRIVLVVGDLGFGVVEPFARQFPDRFINAGVAEQNMIGIAAGLALCGRIVFTYSIGNFSTLRCLEQIRNDVCYHAANVKIVSVGGGLVYGSLGISHHTTEDIAIMRALPQMIVLAPGDPVEAELAVKAAVNRSGPVYLRLGRSGEVQTHSSSIEFAIGKAIKVKDGDDLALISTGTMLHETVAAAEVLAANGLHARVLSMHTIKPLDEDAILTAARETSAMMTIEEHSITGGLGSAVAEVLAERTDCGRVTFRRLGLPPRFTSLVGSQAFLKEYYGLSVAGIVNAARKLCCRADAREIACAF